MRGEFIREVKKLAAITISFAFLFSWINILKNNILQQEETENVEIVKIIPKVSNTSTAEVSNTPLIEASPTPAVEKEYSIELSDETDISDCVVAQGIDINVFKSYNPSTIAAVAVPGTRIYYPVCFPFDINNPGEWLDKNFSLKHSYHGVIYLDSINNPQLSDTINTLYGHNMKDGSMFADINRYLKDNQYIKDHSNLFLITEKEISMYSAVGVMQVSQNEGTYRQTNYDKPLDYEKFYQSILEKSKYLVDKPMNTNNVLQLITCSPNHNYRTILFLTKSFSIPNVLDEKNNMSAEVEALTKGNRNYRSLYSNFIKINSEEDMLFITDKNDNNYAWTRNVLEEKYRGQLGLDTKYISGYGEFSDNGVTFSIYNLNGDSYLILKGDDVEKVIEFKIIYTPIEQIKVKKMPQVDN